MDFFVGKNLFLIVKLYWPDGRTSDVTQWVQNPKKMYNLKRQSGLRSEEFFLKNVDFNINFSILALYGHIRCTLSRDI